MTQMTIEGFEARYGKRAIKSPKATKQASFRPSEEQVKIACYRLTQALAKYRCIIHVESLDEAVAFGCKHVFNRGNQLGSRREGEFKLVIVTALERLLRNGSVKLDTEIGTLTLASKPQKVKASYRRGKTTQRKARPYSGGRYVA